MKYQNIYLNILFLLLFFISSNSIYSQIGIGTVSPQASLDISNISNGGILIPRYALTGSNDTTTVINPQGTSLEISTLIYNTTQVIGVNGIEEGFVYWDGTRWICISPKTQIMQRSLNTANLSSNQNNSFNFDNEFFNNIEGSSFTGTTLTLPRGIYELTATLRVNERVSVDYIMRLDGVHQGTAGTSSAASFDSNAGSYSPAVSIFEITNGTGDIDFRFINTFAQNPGGNVNDGITVLSGQCFMILKRL